MQIGDWFLLGAGATVFSILGIVAWYKSKEKVLKNGKNTLKSRD